MDPLTELLSRWREDLSAWAIPDHITAGAAESPWVLPRQVFARRADRLRRAPGGPSFERAWEALDPAGSVLDVGSGAGAACLPLAPRITTLTAVDADEPMLGLLAGRAGEAGLAAQVVHGRWPGIAGQVAPADVVTCHHVVFNVPDLGPFLDALTDHARRRVVVETATRHPLTSLNPLWLRFYGLKRPERPIARDMLAILAAMGRNPRHTEWSLLPKPTTSRWRNWWRSPGAGCACRPSGPARWRPRWWSWGAIPGSPVILDPRGGTWSRSGGRGARERVAIRLVP